MKSNIYDRFLTEIFFRLSGTTAASRLVSTTLTISGGNTDFVAGYSANHTFTSEVINIPPGYSVKANGNVIVTQLGTYTGSSAAFTTPNVLISLPDVGNEFVVTSTVTLEHDTEDDIVLTRTITLRAVTSVYFGVKAYSATPTLVDLDQSVTTTGTFTLTSTGLGRLLIALPAGSLPLVSITDPNGLTILVSAFTTHTNVVGYTIYQLTYDTIFTGSSEKIFTLNFV